MTLARGLSRALATAGLLLSAGCSAGDPTAGPTPSGDIGGLAPTKGGSAEAAAPTALPVSIGAVQVLPVVGAPAGTVAILSEALAREARRAGVTLAPADGPATPLRLKGYLSALGEGRGTLLIYVWDVVDPEGTRLTRIQGQERAAGGAPGGDPWAGVGPDVLGRVAARTIDALARQGSAG